MAKKKNNQNSNKKQSKKTKNVKQDSIVKNEEVIETEVLVDEEKKIEKNKKQNKTKVKNTSDNNENTKEDITQETLVNETETNDNHEDIIADPVLEIEEVEDSNTLVKNSANKKYLYYAAIVLALILLLIFVFIPLFKEQSANNLYSKGQYEKAINTLDGMNNRKRSSEIIDKCEYGIALKTAEHILNNDPEFKNKDFKVEEISEYRSSLDYGNKTENASFNAKITGKDYSLINSYVANNALMNDGNWNVLSYSLENSQVIPNKKSNKEIVDSQVLKDYPKAVFKETIDNNPAEIEYIYEISTYDNPLYRTINSIHVKDIYDKDSNSWKIASISKDVIDNQLINKTTFKTSVLTVDLPETWIVVRRENEYTYTVDGSDRTDYSYSYDFYFDESKTESVLGISTYYSDYLTYNSSTGDSNLITSKNIGKGSYSIYNKNISATFWPTIRNKKAYLYVNSHNISVEELQEIVDSIVIKDNKYSIRVIAKGDVNIRDDSSVKSGKVISKAKPNDTFTATRAVVNEGYTWYLIGNGRWIADDGTWLEVK